MTIHRSTKTFRTEDCTIEYRRIESSEACEIFYICRPASEYTARAQADAIYQAIAGLLAAEGADKAAVVAETVFFKDIRSDLAAVRSARSSVFGPAPGARGSAALTEIEQPPHSSVNRIEILGHAIIANERTPAKEVFLPATACSCPECAGPKGLSIKVGKEQRLYAGGVYGAGANAYEQTRAMFEAAEALLQNAGMAFSDVMRTWIHFADMERDYDDFNRARREFFRTRNVEPVPASTGIGAGLAAGIHTISLGLYAVTGAPTVRRSVMTTPTLNEAPEYGSDFSRGMRVEEANRSSLYISGTASLDEAGATVHLGDINKQADRMLVNVAGLLTQQGAAFSDIVYAITYVKNGADGASVADKLAEAGYEGFPHAVVEAPVCRPELLCETEAFAIAPCETR